MEKENIRKIAEQTLHEEALAIQGLKQHIDDEFVHAIEVILEASGRVIITGIGKSSDIGRKFTATLNSTGTPAFFLHAADAIHGDLGMMQENDIAILISKSGESAEIKVLVPLIKNFGNTLIALSGNEHSFLVKEADYFINCTVETEACPNNLAPTSSTTAQLVMGDALAVCLLKLKGFTPGDFARFHPGGALGKQLYLKVYELTIANQKPVVKIDSGINEVILEITGKRLGSTAVLDNENLLKGIITDGDIRRMIEHYPDFKSLFAKDIMNANPKTIQADELAVNALTKMRTNNISQLVVLQQDEYIGMVHLHDLLREGLI